MRAIIVEVHLPFAHPNLTKFLQDMKKEYKLDTIILHDLADAYQFSRFPKDPEAQGCVQELMETRGEIRKVAKIFPKGIDIKSNHTIRVIKRALEAGIPSELLKSMREILELPNRWECHDEIVIDNVLHSHGEGFSGDALTALSVHRQNMCLGHFHSKFGLQFVNNGRQQNWVMNIGCAIDVKRYAFNYIKGSKQAPVLGAGIIIDGIPLLQPF